MTLWWQPGIFFVEVRVDFLEAQESDSWIHNERTMRHKGCLQI